MTRLLSSMTAAAVFAALTASSAMAQTKSPPAPAMKLSDAQCTTLWNRLDTGKSGSIAQAQAQPYVTDFKAVDTNNDGKLSQAEFASGCGKGLIHEKAS